MGVGAIFISTLALRRLPVPHDPPQNQQEMLAAMLQPIVSFIVLGSILIRKSSPAALCNNHTWSSSSIINNQDGLSIPFFSVSQEMHVSLSRTLTSRSGQTNNPDWLLWARRAPPPELSPGEAGDETQTTTVDVEAGLTSTPEIPTSGASTIREPQHQKQSSSAQASQTSETLMAQGVLPPPGIINNIMSPSSPQLTKAVRFPSDQ